MNPAQPSDPAAQPKRTVHAPPSDVAPGVALSVELAGDEDVQWLWRHSGGKSQITGYQVIKKPASQ